MTTTTMVTNYHQDQRRSQRTEVQQREASLGPTGVDEENDTEDDTEDELEDETGDEVAVGGDEESDGDCDRKKSAVFLHLLSHPKCLQVYDDFSFSVLCRARYASQLKVLEAVCIRLHKADLQVVSVMGSRVVGEVKSTRITFILLLSGTHLRYNY